MIDFDWYRSFIAIYQLGTVTGAAEARFLTQPAVTQHLAALEAAVGCQLFTRTPRRMIPTEQGKELYTQTIQALEKLEQVSQKLRSQAGGEPPLIRLGTPLEYFYEIALAKLGKKPLRLWVQFDVAENLLDKLEQGELDIAIATKRMNKRNLEYSSLGSEQFVLVSSPLLITPTSDDLSAIEYWLAQQQWISYGVELPIIRRFWQQTFQKRPEFQPALVIPNLHSILKAVELSDGISLIPNYLYQQAVNRGRLKLLWEPPQPVLNNLWLAYRKSDRHRLEINQIKTLLTTTSSNPC